MKSQMKYHPSVVSGYLKKRKKTTPGFFSSVSGDRKGPGDGFYNIFVLTKICNC